LNSEERVPWCTLAVRYFRDSALAVVQHQPGFSAFVDLTAQDKLLEGLQQRFFFALELDKALF